MQKTAGPSAAQREHDHPEKELHVKVTMKVDVTGTRDGQPWPARGETLDVPDDEARELIHAGIADPVVDKKTEKATAPKAEQR